MGNSFTTARHCLAALSILQQDLKSHSTSTPQSQEPAAMTERPHKRPRRQASVSVFDQPRADLTTGREATGYTSFSAVDMTAQYALTVNENEVESGPGRIENAPPNVSWSDSMVSADIDDVFGSISWEALFQGDGTDRDDWHYFDDI
jgi:hypothetical protein